MDYFVSLKNVALLIVLVLPGYFLRKKKLLSDKAPAELSALLLNVTLPCLVFTSYQNKEYESGLIYKLAICMALTVFLLVLMYAVSRVCFSMMKESAAKRAAVTAGYLNNASFIGIPVIQAFFPGQAMPLIYTTIFIAGFNLIAYTLAIYNITGERKWVSVKKALLNPPTIAMTAAFLLFVYNIKPPQAIITTFNFFGNMTTPLSMTVIGIRLAGVNLRELFSTPLAYLSAAVKLIVSPLVTLAVVVLLRRFTAIDGVMCLTLYVEMGMPTAAMVSLFSELHGGDGASAAKCVMLSSILCVFTLPAVMLLAGFV
jgi:predicted permease